MSKRVDDILHPEEKVAVVAQTSIVTPVFWTVIAALMAIFSIGAKGFSSICVIAIFIAAYQLLSRSRKILIVTDKRVVKYTSILTDNYDELSSKEAETTRVRQGIIQKIFNCGRLVVTGTGGSNHDLGVFDDVNSLRRAMAGGAQYNGSKVDARFFPVALTASFAIALFAPAITSSAEEDSSTSRSVAEASPKPSFERSSKSSSNSSSNSSSKSSSMPSSRAVSKASSAAAREDAFRSELESIIESSLAELQEELEASEEGEFYVPVQPTPIPELNIVSTSHNEVLKDSVVKRSPPYMSNGVKVIQIGAKEYLLENVQRLELSGELCFVVPIITLGSISENIVHTKSCNDLIGRDDVVPVNYSEYASGMKQTGRRVIHCTKCVAP